jgi:hypothetical protein
MNTDALSQTTNDKPTPNDKEEYALFAGHCYYPSGGASDFKSFGTIDHLKELYAKYSQKWATADGDYDDPWGQIAKRETLTILMTIRGHGEWTDRSKRKNRFSPA